MGLALCSVAVMLVGVSRWMCKREAVLEIYLERIGALREGAAIDIDSVTLLALKTKVK